MKILIPTILILFVFCFSECKKHKPETPVEQLPPVTQSGKNTLGFLLNGQPWTPAGNNGRANLSIYVDINYKKGTFNITAYRILSNANRESVGFGIADSLIFQSIPETLKLGKHSLFGLSLITNQCTYDFFDSSTYRSGQLTLSKFDKTNQIISGTFDVVLYKSGCGDTLKITEGRFDMKY